MISLWRWLQFEHPLLFSQMCRAKQMSCDTVDLTRIGPVERKFVWDALVAHRPAQAALLQSPELIAIKNTFAAISDAPPKVEVPCIEIFKALAKQRRVPCETNQRRSHAA